MAEEARPEAGAPPVTPSAASPSVLREPADAAAAALAQSGLLLCGGLDNFVDPKGFEGNALMNRDVFVRNLSAKNGCPLHAWPQQQVR